jgi:hypothetical protein
MPSPSRLISITESLPGNSILGHVLPGNDEIKQPLIVRWMVPIIDCLHLHGPPIINGDVWPSPFFVKPALWTVKFCGDEESMPITNCRPDFLFGNVGTWSEFSDVGLLILCLLTKKWPYAECETPAALFKKQIAYERLAALDLVHDERAVDLIRSYLTIPATRPTAQDLIHHCYFAARAVTDRAPPSESSNGRFVILLPTGVKSLKSFPNMRKGMQDLR